MTEMKTDWTIEVTDLVDLEGMDFDDLDPHDNCSVDGAYRLRLEGALRERDDPTEAALDVFHSIVPISALDDFEIPARLATPPDEGDGWLRRDLGAFHEVPSPFVGMDL
jgi:hypothetical protein